MSNLSKLNLEILRKNAKLLLKELASGSEEALGRFKKAHGQNPGNEIKLTSAQHVIAVELDFLSWPAMLKKMRQENFQDIDDACKHLKSGKMLILIDDENRENEGDLCIIAELADASDINFMIKNGRGTVCLSLSDALAESIGLKRKVVHSDLKSAPFTQSIDAIEGISTGVARLQARRNTE